MGTLWNVDFDVSDVKLYVDGVEETPYGFVSSVAINTAVAGDDVKIGVFAATARYFDGRIDDVRIYSRGLSAGEIWGLAN